MDADREGQTFRLGLSLEHPLQFATYSTTTPMNHTSKFCLPCEVLLEYRSVVAVGGFTSFRFCVLRRVTGS